MINQIDDKKMKCQKKYLLVLVPRKMLHLHGSIEEHHDPLHGFCDFLYEMTKICHV